MSRIIQAVAATGLFAYLLDGTSLSTAGAAPSVIDFLAFQTADSVYEEAATEQVEQPALAFTAVQLQSMFDELLDHEFPDQLEKAAAKAMIEDAAQNAEGTEVDSEDLLNRLMANISVLVNDEIGEAVRGDVDTSGATTGKAGLAGGGSMAYLLKRNMASKLRLIKILETFWLFVRMSKKFVPPHVPHPHPPHKAHPPQKSHPHPVPPPMKGHPSPTTSSTTSAPGHTTKPAPPAGTTIPVPKGNSETTLFLNVAPLVLLNRICQGQREACAQVFAESLHTAIYAETQDPQFTKDRVKMGNVTPRGSGVAQVVIIVGDGDLRFAKVLEKVMADVPKCSSNPSLPICQTMTGDTLAKNNVAPTVSGVRVVQ
ncbi:transmembrane protein [Cystoisospora suis]|uniref:Transmembrane protein n=1 Tax=Cystoisospora suis TaxID=483139 RepID=A0A2C6KS29_9APIC|nr:transmembrane protein [Cystoisospora suis]